jgi:hypothetical protein
VHPYVVSHLNAKLQNWQWPGIYFFQEKSRNVHRIAGLLIRCNSFAESSNLVQQTGPYSPSLLISCSVTTEMGGCQRRHYHRMGDRLDNPWSWRSFPEQWSRFRDGAPEEERTGSLVGACRKLYTSSAPPHPRMEEGAEGSQRKPEIWIATFVTNALDIAS